MFIIGVFLIVLILLHRSRYLIALLFEEGGRDSLFLSEVPPENTTLPLLIPKIIHQTYKDENLPEHWEKAQYAVKYYHPDYEYMVRLPYLLTHITWKQGADRKGSSGQTRAVSSSSKLTTHASSLRIYPTSTPSSVLTPCATC